MNVRRLLFPDAGLEITVELARTPVEHATGLSHRASLPWDHGMLFVFNSNADRAFWMYKTFIPLDIIFLDDNFNVVGILENMQPHDTMLRRIKQPSRYALEVNAGFVRAHSIRVGQRLVEIATPLG